MSVPAIESVIGTEVLDSRGRPTVLARCALAGGAVGEASVPAGASTGAAEAFELRDGDAERYGGFGCRQAARNLSHEIHRAVAGMQFESQQALDTMLVALDGTAELSRLGSNAVLAISLAYARAIAVAQQVPLYQSLASLVTDEAQPARLPRPTINLFSGGKHAGGHVPIQDVLIVPAAARTVDEALATAFAVYQSAASLIRQRYGDRPLTADEGGLAPSFESVEAMLAAAVDAIRAAGFEPGRDVALAVDVAASHFYQQGRYQLSDTALNGGQMIDRIEQWCRDFPIVSVEDGLAEEAWQEWPELLLRLRGKSLVLGDDLLCTQPERIRRAVELHAADALLLKVNQVGTLSAAAESLRLARAAGWYVTVSARSGETEDDWLADLAVGWSGDQLKVGSITQSERLAKYNRLLRIEAETQLPLVDWPLQATREGD